MSLKKEDTVYLISPCHPSTTHSSTRNWIALSTNWNMQLKSNFPSDLYWKTLKMERVDTFMHTKTIQFCRCLNLCVIRRIWSTWKENCRKWILLIIEQEREVMDFFSSCSKIYRCVLEILYYLNPFRKTTIWTILLSKEIRDNPTMTTSFFWALVLHWHGNNKLE